MTTFRGICKRVNPLPFIEVGRFNIREVYDRFFDLTRMYWEHIIVQQLYNQTTLGMLDVAQFATMCTAVFCQQLVSNAVKSRGSALIQGNRLSNEAIRAIMRWKGPKLVPKFVADCISASLEDGSLSDYAYSRHLIVVPALPDEVQPTVGTQEEEDPNWEHPARRRRLINGGFVHGGLAAPNAAPEAVNLDLGVPVHNLFLINYSNLTFNTLHPLQVWARIEQACNNYRNNFDRLIHVLQESGQEGSVQDVTTCVSYKALHYYSGFDNTCYEGHRPTCNYYSSISEDTVDVKAIYSTGLIYVQSLCFDWAIHAYPALANMANQNMFYACNYLVCEADAFDLLKTNTFYFQKKH